MPYYASLDKIASAETALGAPIALEDSLVLKQLVVALGNVTAGGGGGGSGDVVGPASSTDNAIAAFDGATGKLLKNSNLLVGAGTLTFPGAVSGTAVLQAPPIAGSAAVTLPSVTGTLAIIGNNVSQFAAGGTLSSLTGFSLRSTGAAFDLSLATNEVLTANRTLKFNVGNADRTLTIPATGTAALLETANVFTALQTVSLGTNSATAVHALSLANSTAATAGVQSASGFLSFLGQGWKTNATAGSQAVQFNVYNLPVQGAASPTGSLIIDCSVNGGAASQVARFVSVGSAGTGRLYCDAFSPVTGSTMYFDSTVYNRSGGFLLDSTLALAWNLDTFLHRKAAATLQMGADSATVTNQMFTAASRITSDGVGANLTIAGGNGRGGAGGALILSTYDTGAAATIGTLRSRMTFDTAGAVAFPVVTAVTTETVVSDTTWPVTINGVAYKICLKA